MRGSTVSTPPQVVRRAGTVTVNRPSVTVAAAAVVAARGPSRRAVKPARPWTAPENRMPSPSNSTASTTTAGWFSASRSEPREFTASATGQSATGPATQSRPPTSPIASVLPFSRTTLSTAVVPALARSAGLTRTLSESPAPGNSSAGTSVSPPRSPTTGLPGETSRSSSKTPSS